MIIKEYFYAIECDNCKKVAGSNEHDSAWLPDEDGAKDNAVNGEQWHEEGDKHYCPHCFSFDDEDNLIIKPNSAIVPDK